jgi:hypothetical protein
VIRFFHNNNVERRTIKLLDKDNKNGGNKMKEEKAETLKVIFLDVDGELTYSNYDNPETHDIDIEKVKLLKEICDRTGAKVVISSSWRGAKNYTPHIYHVLVDILTNNGIEVLGDTPYIDMEFEDNDVPDIIASTTLEDLPELKIKYGTGRGAEIQQWLNEHDVESFVILDDEDWNWSDYEYDTHWIQPTWFGDGGLKREHVEKAVEILEGKIIR